MESTAQPPRSGEGPKLSFGDWMLATVMAIVVALVLGLLAWLLKRYGIVVERPAWLLASLFFVIGALPIILVILGSKARWLWGAVPAFAISVIFFVKSAPSTPFDLVKYSSIDWKELADHAETEVRAEGMVLEALDIDKLIHALRQSNRLKVRVVLLDPEGKAVLQRSYDENPRAPNENKIRIIEKIRRFQVARNDPASGDWKDRFELLVRDTYPTMAVIVVDEDLYAYLYSFRQNGTESPVFKVSDFKHSGALAKFFEDHLLQSLDPSQGAYTPRDYTNYPISPAAEHFQ